MNSRNKIATARGRWIGPGEVRPVIDRTFPLSDVAGAVRHLASGRARDKTVITVHDPHGS